MKKYIIVLLISVISIIEVIGQTGCQNEIISSPGFYTKQANYFCHQYVKAALLGDMMGNGWVDLATGIPTHSESNFLNFTGEIATDQNFIQVCTKSNAKAVVPSPGGNTEFHSAIILDNGLFASTPNGSTQYIYKHQNPRTFTSACIGEEKYYAPIPQIVISGASTANQGMQFTLTSTNNGQSLPSFLQLHKDRWFFDSYYFTEVPNTKTATSITLTANSISGYSDITYNLITGCNGNNFYRTKPVQVLPNRTGILNGGPLYTFNSVSTGSNQIVMFLNSWTWVKHRVTQAGAPAMAEKT